MTRHGGFAPEQWLLSRIPCNPATMGDEDECLDVGALQAYADGPTTLGYSHVTEQKHAGLSYVGTEVNGSDAPLCEGSHLWLDSTKLEMSSRFAEKHAQANTEWNAPLVPDLIGFEKDKNSLGETQSRTCWVICDSLPVCVAVDRLRPCTPAELLAFHYMQTKSSSPLAADAQVQQGFIDERAPLNSTTADPSRTVGEGEDEDERNDEVSEPTRKQKSEKRFRRTT